MSAKNKDTHERWRCKTIAFRVSPEEDAQINRMVAISGLSKQEYLTTNMLKHKLVIKGSSRLYKGLKNEMTRIAEDLSRMADASEADEEFRELVRTAMQIYEGLKEAN